ncbi:hypothetical protein P691DRAFT_782203 [Macrolepiota fuliginosa MF-IS2]|uniref:Uncharacterized protein n=1 Tax=Macrolepiota fuliginosa MF-IS2 TaxID=1400762 RepID=A0A9P6C0P9_9AGAR|nr:hypothetical protein P691DRAFT_782203 [Macrolepiota fuliginosa MF-IS2]
MATFGPIDLSAFIPREDARLRNSNQTGERDWDQLWVIILRALFSTPDDRYQVIREYSFRLSGGRRNNRRYNERINVAAGYTEQQEKRVATFVEVKQPQHLDDPDLRSEADSQVRNRFRPLGIVNGQVHTQGPFMGFGAIAMADQVFDPKPCPPSWQPGGTSTSKLEGVIESLLHL